MAWQLHPLTLLQYAPPPTLKDRSFLMLNWVVIFLILALVAGIFGFSGIAAGAAGFAKILFFIFLVLLVISFITGKRAPTS